MKNLWYEFWFLFAAGFGAYDVHVHAYGYAYFMALCAVHNISYLVVMGVVEGLRE